MTMLNPLAFSTEICPSWDLDRVLSTACDLGYGGVELCTLNGKGESRYTSDPAKMDPEVVRAAFEKANVELVCVSTRIALHQKRAAQANHAVSVAKNAIDLTDQLGCTRMRMFGSVIRTGENTAVAISRIAAYFAELAEYAESTDVEILIENSDSFAGAREMWSLLTKCNHPLVGSLWNAVNAEAIGETPSVSVNIINARIGLARISNTTAALGDGDVDCRRYVELLRGLGYKGWLSYEWGTTPDTTIENPEAILKDVAETLHEWMREKLDKRKNVLSRWEAEAHEVKPG